MTDRLPSMVELLQTDVLLDELATRRPSSGDDHVLDMLAALADAVDEAPLPALPAQRVARVTRAPQHHARSRSIGAVLAVGLTLSSSGIAAAVTGDPLLPIKTVVKHLYDISRDPHHGHPFMLGGSGSTASPDGAGQLAAIAPWSTHASRLQSADGPLPAYVAIQPTSALTDPEIVDPVAPEVVPASGPTAGTADPGAGVGTEDPGTATDPGTTTTPTTGTDPTTTTPPSPAPTCGAEAAEPGTVPVDCPPSDPPSDPPPAPPSDGSEDPTTPPADQPGEPPPGDPGAADDPSGGGTSSNPGTDPGLVPGSDPAAVPDPASRPDTGTSTDTTDSTEGTDGTDSTAPDTEPAIVAAPKPPPPPGGPGVTAQA